jgi:hypothetical protein
MSTEADAVSALKIVVKHLFAELEQKKALSPLERDRMLDSVKIEIGQTLGGGDRFHAVFGMIGDLWE